MAPAPPKPRIRRNARRVRSGRLDGRFCATSCWAARCTVTSSSTPSLLIGAVAVVIFLFADHRSALQGSYTRILNRLQGAVGGPLSDTTHTGLLHDLDRLFAVPTGRLYLYGAVIAVYAGVNGIEAVGLWRARRWAEYLTLIEVAVLLPVEIHELTVRISLLKILTMLINLAVVAYLLWAHRLFGVRGGGRADQAEKDRDTGWEPLQRTTPWTLPAPAPLVGASRVVPHQP